MSAARLFDLAVEHYRAGRFEQSLAATNAALQIQPNAARLHFSRGNALLALQRPADAAAAFRAGLKLQPDDLQGRTVLGQILLSIEELDEAGEQFRLILEREPGSVAAASSLAKILKTAGHQEQADALLQRWADHWVSIARTSRDASNRLAEMQALIRALQLQPRHPTAQTAMSGLLLQFDSVAQAEAILFDAIDRLGAPPATLGLLGNVLKEIGYVNLALECYARGLERKPDVAAASNFLYALLYDPLQDADEVAQQHREWAHTFARPHYPSRQTWPNQPIVDCILRVGYVSGHFNDHAVALFSLPLLQAHDRGQVDIYCYDNTGVADDYTRAFAACASGWRDIAALDDDAAAALIRHDAIDILVDLSGHIAGNRLLIFARKPAPIQVTYLGYQATTGMAVIDYRLTDAIADQVGYTDRLYAEALVRLEPAFFVYQPSSYAPPVATAPFERNGYITFGCLNNPTKTAPSVVETWAALLRQVSTAHLVLLGPASHDADPRIERFFDAYGIDPSRLHILGKRPRRAYLQAYDSIDIALDPFPFTGHTTTCDALWQGVPVVTLAGNTYAERMSASTLTNANLGHLVATSADEYVRIASELAADTAALSNLRTTMRQRLSSSAILDAPRFARGVEAAYRGMWVRWCAKQQQQLR